MTLPIDISKLKKSAYQIQEASLAELKIDILVDKSVGRQFFRFVKDLFVSYNPHVSISFWDITVLAKRPTYHTDLCIILAGKSLHCFSSYIFYASEEISTCFLSINPQDLLDFAASYNYKINSSQVIVPDYSTYGVISVDGEECLNFEELNTQMQKSLADKLAAFICSECSSQKLSFGASFDFMTYPVCKSCINTTALQNAGVGIIPFIPGADMPVMTLNQAKMLLQIASVYGYDVGEDRIIELIVLALSAVVLKATCGSIKTHTGLPSFLVNGIFGLGGTYLLGYSALSYFKSGGSIENMSSGLQKAWGKVKLPDNIISFVSRYVSRLNG